MRSEATSKVDNAFSMNEDSWSINLLLRFSKSRERVVYELVASLLAGNVAIPFVSRQH